MPQGDQICEQESLGESVVAIQNIDVRKPDEVLSQVLLTHVNCQMPSLVPYRKVKQW